MAEFVARWRRLEDGGVDAIRSRDHFNKPNGLPQTYFEATASLAGLLRRRPACASGSSSAPSIVLADALHEASDRYRSHERRAAEHRAGGRWRPGRLNHAGRRRLVAEGTGAAVCRVRRTRPSAAREDDVTHAGAFYRTTGAIMQPWFVQKPRPAFTLAAHGPTTMKVAARYVDTWNTYGPSLDSAREDSARLDVASPRLDEILTRSVGRRSSATSGISWILPATSRRS